MKKITLLVVSFAALATQAQNIKLTAGKKILAKTVSVMNMDMASMGQQMKINSETNNTISIVEDKDKNYNATNTITKIKMEQDGMGQNTSYDSDKKEDASSVIGKEMSGKVNTPAPIAIDKTTGKVVGTGKKVEDKEEDKNPFADLMGGKDPVVSTAATAFFVLDASKKIGDKWADSTNEAGMKVVKVYELKSIENNIANINVKTTTKGTLSKEVQGNQMEISLNGTGTEELTLDAASGLVKKNVANSNTDGSMDIMGQSITFNMKATVTSTFD